MSNPTTSTPLTDEQLQDIFLSVDCDQLATRWKCSTSKVYQQINANKVQILAYAAKRLSQRDSHLKALGSDTARRHLHLSYSELVKRMRELDKAAAETSYLFKLHDRFKRAHA